MLDLENELRAVLRERANDGAASSHLEARIDRRLRASVRRRRMVAATVSAAVVATAAVAAGAVLGHDNHAIHVAPKPTPATQPATRRPVVVEVGGWATIADPPMTGAYASVWTGTELVVAFRAPTNVRFAAYDPAHDSWVRIPDPPIDILADFTSDSTMAWTGSTVLVWGYENHGTDTFSGHHRLLSYDPATDRWTQLPSPPIDTLIQAHPIWTGRELLVWGGNFNGELAPATGLSYDPATNRWTILPPAPLSTRENPTIVWTGRELIVWGGLTSDQQTKPDRNEGAAYDPDTNSWRALPSSGLPPMELAAAAWTGNELIVLGTAAAGQSGPDVGAAYDPTTNQWRPIAATPMSQREQMSSTWTGHELIVWGGISFAGSRGTLADGAAYDPTTNTWRMLAASPLGSRWGASMTPTGDGLVIVVGGYGPTNPVNGDEPVATGAAAYRP
jgi:hypothetical protein